MKAKIAIVGSGNIGWALKQLLKKDYDLKQGDIEAVSYTHLTLPTTT